MIRSSILLLALLLTGCVQTPAPPPQAVIDAETKACERDGAVAGTESMMQCRLAYAQIRSNFQIAQQQAATERRRRIADALSEAADSMERNRPRTTTTNCTSTGAWNTVNTNCTATTW